MIHKFNSKIVEIKKIGYNVKQFTLSVPQEFQFLPGQFVTVTLNLGEEKIRRSYSIASSNLLTFNTLEVNETNKTDEIKEEKEEKKTYAIELCIKIVEGGRASGWFDKGKVGDDVFLMGPLGHFTIKDNEKDIVFIATGTGISPFRSMIGSLLKYNNNNHNRVIKLITGFRYEKSVLYSDFFRTLEKKYDCFHWYNIISRPEKELTRRKGHVQRIVSEEVLTNFIGHIYLCGLYPMIEDTVKLLKEKNIETNQIFYERFS